MTGSSASASASASAQNNWTQGFSGGSGFSDTFAEDVVLEASVLYEPVVGSEQVQAVLNAASAIYESLEFTNRAAADDDTFLTWQARAFGGTVLSGVTILSAAADGKIVRAAIHHRPLGPALQFSEELRRRLAGVIPEAHFYRSCD